jgi:glycosyltransferase involved in cell wall biosynthesis
MKIFLGLNNFFTGGAENFVIRLAGAFSEKGHKVYLFALNNWCEQEMRTRLKMILGTEYDKINIVFRWAPGKFRDFFLWNIKGLYFKFGRDNYRDHVIDRIQIKKLRKFLITEGIDVVNTHLWETDQYFSENFDLPHIISMHGPYEDYLYSCSKGVRRMNNFDTEFLKKASSVLIKSGFLIYTAERNLEIFNFFNGNSITRKKIYIGYPDKDFSEARNNFTYKKSEDLFTYGMIGRGVEAKGWEMAIQAFLKIRKQLLGSIRFELVYPNSNYMNGLKEKYGHEEGIIFCGYVENAIQKMMQFDAVLLPTWDDCLPSTIIEAISLDVPVISTQVGEIPEMIKRNEDYAGIVVPVMNDGKATVDNFAKAMKELKDNHELYNKLKSNCSIVALNFNMDECVANYISFYEESISDYQSRRSLNK